jgi:hypothetical protein
MDSETDKPILVDSEGINKLLKECNKIDNLVKMVGEFSAIHK